MYRPKQNKLSFPGFFPQMSVMIVVEEEEGRRQEPKSSLPRGWQGPIMWVSSTASQGMCELQSQGPLLEPGADLGTWMWNVATLAVSSALGPGLTPP